MVTAFYNETVSPSIIARQKRGISKAYPDVEISPYSYPEKITHLTDQFKKGDTIIFESISFLGRDENMCITIYRTFYNKGVELEFVKEPLLNTSVFRGALNKTSNEITRIVLSVAEKQIRTALKLNGEKLEEDSRTKKEYLTKAKQEGKPIGRKAGTKITVRKKLSSMEFIISNAKSFGGTMNDRECIKSLGITEKTYYRYKAEIKASMLDKNDSGSE